ncbi:sprouty-related, EVH1 domain-containing protein 2-like isoform X3 [Lethenteron reissneri]|uniref:sprouty-related, EVH1 domain-containing protein 2-like isoform X3 n=1 Tax=Lethenteron reissneri TaxID=7753 RepID=UPI002AB6BDF8|nr:sprouty-related, EVH1 domain-containing protein 2-like isoform X3 [Lethenteron reissneri]
MSEELLPDDENHIVRVRAVVMTRTDEGWVSLAGGGLSQVLLKCFLKKNLVYTVASPTFHHWMIDDKKFGLSFQTPADARAFNRCVRKAIEDLAEGSTTSSSTNQNEAEIGGDDDVFSPSVEGTSPALAKKDGGGKGHQATARGKLGRHVSFQDEDEEDEAAQGNAPEERGLMGVRGGYDDYRDAAARKRDLQALQGHYVQVGCKGDGKKAEYERPRGSPGEAEAEKEERGSGRFGKVPAAHHPQQLQLCEQQLPQQQQAREEEGVAGGGGVLRCKYCRAAFDPPGNRRGGCPDAPDPARRCVTALSCMCAAESMLYHCMADPEGNYSDPCSCETGGHERFGLRWAALVALSLLVPCLCLYPPLQGCYTCGKVCGCCGGKHKAAG